jgi:hypothetical protein
MAEAEMTATEAASSKLRRFFIGNSFLDWFAECRIPLPACGLMARENATC